MAATHTGALAGSLAAPAIPLAPSRAWTVVLIGAMLGPRLRCPALLKQLGRPVEVLGPFDHVSHAAEALQGRAVDAVVFHEPLLQPAGWRL